MIVLIVHVHRGTGTNTPVAPVEMLRTGDGFIHSEHFLQEQKFLHLAHHQVQDLGVVPGALILDNAAASFLVPTVTLSIADSAGDCGLDKMSLERDAARYPPVSQGEA